MTKEIEVICRPDGTQVTIDDINKKLQERFERIKANNPKGFRDQFDQQWDIICMDIAEELGGVVSDYEPYGKFFDFTGMALVRGKLSPTGV